MTANQELSLIIKRALDWIENKDLKVDELRHMFENANKNEHITEEEKELLINALEKRLRTKDARVAKSLFGPKDLEARETLQSIYNKLSADFDLSKNKVGAGVKTGGDMIAGRAFVDVYISYKNPDNWNAGLGYVQKSPSENPIFTIKFYHRGENSLEGKEYLEFPISELQAAEDTYRSFIRRIL